MNEQIVRMKGRRNESSGYLGGRIGGAGRCVVVTGEWRLFFSLCFLVVYLALVVVPSISTSFPLSLVPHVFFFIFIYIKKLISDFLNV